MSDDVTPSASLEQRARDINVARLKKRPKQRRINAVYCRAAITRPARQEGTRSAGQGTGNGSTGCRFMNLELTPLIVFRKPPSALRGFTNDATYNDCCVNTSRSLLQTPW